jgi:hypothetical protein
MAEEKPKGTTRPEVYVKMLRLGAMELPKRRQPLLLTKDQRPLHAYRLEVVLGVVGTDRYAVVGVEIADNDTADVLGRMTLAMANGMLNPETIPGFLPGPEPEQAPGAPSADASAPAANDQASAAAPAAPEGSLIVH